VCTLANNHILDFGHRGLADTLAALTAAGIDAAGAGLDQERARAPVRLTTEAGTTVLITSLGVASSGIPAAWAATAQRPGVEFLPDLAKDSVADVAARLQAAKRPGEISVASVHIGSNWGWTVSRDQVRFAHALIEAGVDVIHGHSSHHPRPIEVYRGKLILYGCGDLIDDYEGITGYEQYRDDLRLLYIATLDPDRGTVVRLEMTPMQTRKLRLQRASSSDGEWLRSALDRASRDFGTRFSRRSDGRIILSIQ
ncbi:MAG: CapA family protein, partial [Jiangellaceae bacterium]